jgi:D-tyrosyl-tRNA(Tyr) deacylase
VDKPATKTLMIGLLQRVLEARVEIAGETFGQIGPGLLVFLAIERGDTESIADRLVERILEYRVFPDATGRMNLSLRDTKGGLMLVPQFTLAADTRQGSRPSLSPAASPEDGKRLFTHVLDRARTQYRAVAPGVFGADMQVALINDGPVTFWLRVPSPVSPDLS